MARKLSLILPVCVLAASGACGLDYFGQLLWGGLNSISRTVPVAEALNDSRLSEEERAKLALTQVIRQFAIDRIGLTPGDAYTVFEFNGTDPAVYVLSASDKDSLTPFLWLYPFVGTVATRGYFDQAYGQREADDMAARGYDIFFGQAAGFSTLKILADPVRQSNLRMIEPELAEFLFHEMTHSTIFKVSDANFNESLATFVGRAAARTFFEETYGVDSPQAVDARELFADKLIIDEYVNLLYSRMNSYYSAAAARGESSEMIVAGREAEFAALHEQYLTVFEPRLIYPDRWAFNRTLVINNAIILAAITYQGSLSDYQAVFDKVGGSFSDALYVFNQAASQADSRGFLRQFAAGP